MECDAASASAKGAAGSVSSARTSDYELLDGARVIARGRRSEIMKAARRVSHGATVGRVGSEPSFLWSESAGGWVFLGV